jgi:hypothetical protein
MSRRAVDRTRLRQRSSGALRSRLTLLHLVLVLGVLVAVPAPLYAQDADPKSQQLERYLSDHNLPGVLAAHWRRMMLESPLPAEKSRAAEELGRLYVKMLGQPLSAESREALETRAQELLRVVPETESFELRLNLAKASYLRAEEIAEKDRIRLATPDDLREGERILKSVAVIFDDIAGKAWKRVQILEAKERSADENDIEALREDLSYARRTHSLARYYAGWTAYYTALLSKNARLADSAMVDFGWILNAVTGKPATIERLPRGLLVHEHVARAALGCALSASLRRNDIDAMRWLDELDRSEDLHDAVKGQLFSRRVVILGASSRWSEIQLAITRRKQSEATDTQPEKPLPVAEARLLAVLALEALRDPEFKPGFRAAAELVAQLGMGELIARGELAHIVDLVSRYGTAPIGEQGFIAQYVRGIQAYERVRQSHQSAGKPDDPTTDTALVNAYREAAGLMGIAADSPDSAKFPGEAGKARMRQGLALFYASDFEAAATCFQQAAEAAGGPASNSEARRDALWYAIVSLDLAVEHGKPSRTDDRDKLAVLYLKEFPGSANAAKLLLRQTKAELMSDEETLRVLLAVGEDSPVYDAARRQVARILYRAYRRAGAADRPFAGQRFLDTAEDVLRREATRATTSRDAPAMDAAQNTIVLARQVLDAHLASAAPDLARVEEVFKVIEGVSAYHELATGNIQSELTYRRLQLALAKHDSKAIDEHLAKLRQIGGEYAVAADRLLFRTAAELFKVSPDSSDAARNVVRHGLVLLDNARPDDPSLSGVRENVAGACALLYRATNEPAMRDKAIALDKLALEKGVRTIPILRRLGELLEDAGDAPGALGAWQSLLAGLPERSSDWFEARYHSLRLIIKVDPFAASEAYRQHMVLHPTGGPEPWGKKIRDLETQVPVTSPSPGPPSKPGGGP